MLEFELEKQRLPKALIKNERLEKKVEQLESEMDIVDWYLETLESGIDTQ